MNWKPHFEKDIAFHAATADEYDKVVVTPREAMNELLFEDFEALIPAGGRMLDIGCGTGHSILRFGERFRSVIGIDHSPDMLRHAAAKLEVAKLNHVTLVKQDAFSFLRSVITPFNFITAIGFLHHLPPLTLSELLKLASNCVQPGGQLLIAEPIDIDPATQPQPVIDWNSQSVAAGVEFETDAEEADEAPIAESLLVQALTDAGLSIEKRQKAWELFPHQLPPSDGDRSQIADLHREYGDSGNVLCLLCRKQPSN